MTLSSISYLYELNNQANTFADLIAKKTENRKSPKIQEKINEAIRRFKKTIFEHDKSIKTEIFKSQDGGENADRLLHKWESLLEKAGYADTPLVNIKKKVTQILKESQTLYRDYQQFNLEFRAVMSEIVISKGSVEVLKEADRWLKDNLKWFYMNPMKNYIGEDRVQEMQRSLVNLYVYMVTKLETSNKTFQHTISRILPRSVLKLSPELQFEIFKFLPADTPKQREVSQKVIEEEAAKNYAKRFIRYQMLAKWISQQQIPLSYFQPDEIRNIAPYLTYMNLQDATETLTNKEIFELIEQASSSLITLKIGLSEEEEDIEDEDEIVEEPFKLPENLPKLKNLDVSNRRTLREIPFYAGLETLNISRCEGVTTLPALANLKKLDISRSGVTKISRDISKNMISLECMNSLLKSIPASPNLTFLNCSNSVSLEKIGFCPLLEENIHEGCTALIEIATRKVTKNSKVTKKRKELS